jgi:HK97 family phage prohead protease
LGYECKSYKTVFEIKADGEAGTFAGHASIFGNKDWYGDVMDAGAFKRTLDQKGTARKVLWQHDTHAPIGISQVAEDEKGLAFNAKLVMTVPTARDAFELIKAGVIDQMSIGYDTIAERWDAEVRHITEARLWEISPVTFAANELALISAAKSARFTNALEAIIHQQPGAQQLNSAALDEAITVLQKLRAEIKSLGSPDGIHLPGAESKAAPTAAGKASADALENSVREVIAKMRMS